LVSGDQRGHDRADAGAAHEVDFDAVFAQWQSNVATPLWAS
jgi:hypothetical protein